MHDFDAERLAPTEKDRTFRLGGEEFRYQTGVRPDVIARFYDGSPEGNVETLRIYDETVLAFLAPGQEEAWQRVRALEGDEAVTLFTLRDDLIPWLIGEQASRPTGPRLDSSSGSAPQPSGTASTAELVSGEATASTG